jgi:holo-[acyl-carrier protein] synthase
MAEKLAEDAVSRYYALRMRPRVGIDLVRINDVSAALGAFGDRYLDRVFTVNERAHCCDGWTPVARSDAHGASAQTTFVPPSLRVAERLAARFAAKEAVFKLLRSPGGIGYRDVEVVDGRDVILSGAALELARVRHLGPIDVSLTHEGDYAAACVTALEDV